MSNQVRVLLADDSKFFRSIESKFLQKTPVEVLEAESCSETLSIARNEQPELIYMYFSLPEEGGVKCCRSIKAHESLKNIPVVMICDKEQPEQVSAAKAAGCDAVLVKPLDRHSFLQAGRHFLEIIREHRQPSFFTLSFWLNEEEFKGKCLDISGGGIFIETQDEIAVGERLKLEFKLPDNQNTQVSCVGEVMWLNRKPNPMKPHYPNGLGVKFVELSPLVHRAILRLADD